MPMSWDPRTSLFNLFAVLLFLPYTSIISSILSFICHTPICHCSCAFIFILSQYFCPWSPEIFSATRFLFFYRKRFIHLHIFTLMKMIMPIPSARFNTAVKTIQEGGVYYIKFCWNMILAVNGGNELEKKNRQIIDLSKEKLG